MKDLTTQDKELLLGKIKSFLSITWTDEETDNKISDFIVSSINRLDDICGIELDYIHDDDDYDEQYLKLCYLARDLLKNRVFYLNEKAMDDFEENYQSEMVALYLKGKVYKDWLNAEQ